MNTQTSCQPKSGQTPALGQIGRWWGPLDVEMVDCRAGTSSRQVWMLCGARLLLYGKNFTSAVVACRARKDRFT